MRKKYVSPATEVCVPKSEELMQGGGGFITTSDDDTNYSKEQKEFVEEEPLPVDKDIWEDEEE